ncbi:MAG TPA: amino acid permease [Caulobacteraceae bacterium]|jgi:APA family basic amino acid/polyamine antiporter
MSLALKREIGLPSAVLLVIGGIVGTGIFLNPAVVARSLHSPVLILSVWAVGGVMAILGAFVYAELADRMPATGGEFAYERSAFGDLVAFLFGWTTLLVVQTGGMAAVALSFSKYALVLFGHEAPAGGPDPLANIVAVTVLALLAITNCLGVKSGNGVQTLLGVLKLLAIAGLVFGGLFMIAKPFPITHPVLDRAPSTDLVKSFGAALIPVVFAYGGWQTANYVGGEIKNPRRNLVLALLIGVIAVIGLYLAVNIACLRALGPKALGETLAPASDVLKVAIGPVGAKLAALAIAVSTLGYLSQGMLTGPRVYLAMASDGLFFSQLAKVTEKTRVPAVAIVVQAVWTAVLVLSGTYEQIVAYDVSINFLFFAVTGAAVFVFRRRDRTASAQTRADAGFRIPLHPFSTVLFILICIIVVANGFWSDLRDSLIGYSILAAGVPAYFLWRHFPKLIKKTES